MPVFSHNGDLISLLLETANTSSILQEISLMIPFLNEAERSVAEYIISFPQEAAQCTAHQLACASRTSEATIFRFCRSLGYPGFSRVREELQRTLQKIQMIPLTPGQNLDPWSVAVYSAIQTLLDTYSFLDRDSLHASARTIAVAEKVGISGMGPISGRLAEMFAFSLQTAGLPTFVWTDSRGVSLPDDYIGQFDVAIGISHSGNNDDVNEFLKRAKNNQAKTIAITNYPASPIGKVSDFLLCTGIKEPSIRQISLITRISQLLILGILAEMVSKLRADRLDGKCDFE